MLENTGTFKVMLSFGYQAPSLVESITKQDDSWKSHIDPSTNMLRLIEAVYVTRTSPNEEKNVLKLPDGRFQVWRTRWGGWKVLSLDQLVENVLGMMMELLGPEDIDEKHDDKMTEYVRQLINQDAVALEEIASRVASLFFSQF